MTRLTHAPRCLQLTAKRCRLGVSVHDVAKADFLVQVEQCSAAGSVRVGVMQTASQSARTGENWFSPDNVGRVHYCGAGLFSGNYREKSRLSAAVNSGFSNGDVVGVHVCGHSVTFSKNGATIPGKMRRNGPVYFGIQLCCPGDTMSLVKFTHIADGH